MADPTCERTAMDSMLRGLLALLAITVLVVAGCVADEDDGSSPTTGAEESESGSDETDTDDAQRPDEATGELPETLVVARLDDAYDFAGEVPDPSLLPVPEGSVEARWYRAGDVYVVVYDGLAPDVNVCPGNSAQLATGFDYVSNALLADATCEGFRTLIENTAEHGVQICDGRVSYLTLIPSDTVGALFASLEVLEASAGGGGVGLTGSVHVDDPSAAPEVEVSLLAC